ncbi:MAG: homoserine O-succinyltransferase [Allosphingosinicella sp.]|uniref:homoserine O-succinyltransferase MetX n=1 Tax=Allosphingosinicella sp. TaxID=2823234 RepID=UPI00394CEABD
MRPDTSCRDVEVALPPALTRFGARTTCRVSGAEGAPPIVVLGGISADRFACTRADGTGGWWPGLVGAGCAIDPRRHRIIGLDFAADAEGRSAPTTADQAEVLCAALDSTGAAAAELIVGASYGGMVALALAQHRPERVRRLAIISAPAEPHPMATAMRELQRRAVALGLAHGDGAMGLSIARGLAMLTYRTPEEFGARFAGGLGGDDPLAPSAPGAYLRARGDAYQVVMSPKRFLSLSASIDRHRVDPERIDQPTLVIGATSDRLVPPEQVEALAAALPNSRLHLIDSRYGHDLFLKETARIAPLVAAFAEDL